MAILIAAPIVPNCGMRMKLSAILTTALIKAPGKMNLIHSAMVSCALDKYPKIANK